MQTDRFSNYDAEVRELVLSFEEMRQQGLHHYFDIDQLLTIIDFYFEQTDLDLLEDAVEYAEQLFPTATEVRLRRSHVYSVKGQDEQALHILLDLERQEPCNTDVQYALGAVYSMMNQPTRAIQHYQRSSADGYELGMVFGNIADEYYKLGNDRDAIRYYKRAIANNPKEERSLYNLGSLYCDQIDEDDTNASAIEDYFEQFVSDNPYSKVGWYCLAGVYTSLSLWEKAIDAYEFALTIDKTFFSAYTGISHCYERLRRPSEAVSSLREALNYTDDKPFIYDSIAGIYRGSHNFDMAIIYYRKALNEEPYHYESLEGLARCYAFLGDYASAVDAVERAIAINPRSAYAIWLAGSFYEQMHNNEKAEAMYACATQLEPDDDGYWLNYADFLMQNERYDEALELLKNGMTYAERLGYFHLRLAVCYFKLEKRNMLYNTIRDVIEDPEIRSDMLFRLCPDMANDIDVVNIINSK